MVNIVPGEYERVKTTKNKKKNHKAITTVDTWNVTKINSQQHFNRKCNY